MISHRSVMISHADKFTDFCSILNARHGTDFAGILNALWGTSRHCGASCPRGEDATPAGLAKRVQEGTLLFARVSTGELVWLPRGWTAWMVGASGKVDEQPPPTERPGIAWWPCLQAEPFEEGVDHARMHVLAVLSQASVRSQWPEVVAFETVHADAHIPPTAASAPTG